MVNNDDFYNGIKEEIAKQLKAYFTGTNECTINYVRKNIATANITKPIIRFYLIDATKDPDTRGDRDLGTWSSGQRKGSFHYLSFGLLVTCNNNIGGEKKRDTISALLHKFAYANRRTFGQANIKDFDISSAKEVMTDPNLYENLHMMTCKYLFYNEV